MIDIEKRRRAIRNYQARRTAAGERKVTMWLSPESQQALERLRAKHGSKDAAVNKAIQAYDERENGPDFSS